MNAIKLILALMFFSVAGPGQSGVLEQATFEGQVQMQITQGRVESCGIRIFGAANKISPKVIGIDTSVNVAKPGYGMVKGLAYHGTLDEYAKGKLSRLPLQLIWLRKPGGLTTVPDNGKYLESPETKLAILYPTSVDSAFGILDAVLEREPVQIGFRLADATFDTIYFGVVKMTNPEMMQLEQCLATWAESILKQLEPQKPNSKK